MIDIRWYERIGISTILTFLAFLLCHFVFKSDGWKAFAFGSFGWQVFDQIIYTIRFKRL